MKSYVVIGLGRFGTAVATELCALGSEVLAIDEDQSHVQAIADRVTHAVAADARDPAVLKTLGVKDFDCAVVAVGGDIGGSALITLSLKEMGVPEVVCKAQSHVHRRVLEKIGADRVVFPEHEMGVKLAQGLTRSNVLNFIELSENYGIVEAPVPRSWQGKTLQEANVRGRYRVNVIAVRDNASGEMRVSPGGDYIMHSTDTLVLLGEDKDTGAVSDL